MTNEEFRRECHDYIDEVYDDFIHKRNTLIEIAKVFHELCVKNNIRYYVVYGSLLGLVRDEGLIPWDRDIDVCICAPDLERLHEAFKRDLPKGYYYESIYDNPKYPLIMTRLFKEGYDKKAFNLDIYYLFGGGNNKEECERTGKYLCEMLENRKIGIVKPIRDSYYSKYIYAFNLFKHYVFKIKTSTFTQRKFFSIINKYKMENSQYYILLNMEHPIPKEDFETTASINAFGINWSVPCGYYHYLSTHYGKYQEYLPIEKRFEEMLDGHKCFNGKTKKK